MISPTLRYNQWTGKKEQYPEESLILHLCTSLADKCVSHDIEEIPNSVMVHT
jgi:hypothetical protein